MLSGSARIYSIYLKKMALPDCKTLFIIVTVLALNQAESYVPLGMDGFKVKIYLPEFNAYGMRTHPSSNSDIPLSVSEDEQEKFRRHIRIDSPQESRKRPAGDVDDPEEDSKMETLKKFFNRNIVHEIYPNKRRLRFDTRGNVTFLSRQGGMQRLEKFLKHYNPELHSEDDSLTGTSAEDSESVTSKPSYFDNLQYLRSTKDAFLKSFQKSVLSNHKFGVSHETSKRVPRKPMEILIPEQYERVLNMAEQMQIPTGMEGGSYEDGKQFLIVSPKGLPDEGSLAHIRIKPEEDNGKIKQSFNLNIMRGPYDDIYHRQYHNDMNGVSSILGKSAKFHALPDKNTILSKIILNTDWDIYRLR